MFKFSEVLFIIACGCLAGGASLHAESADTRPIVYLTFDDGPSADDATEKLLDVLATYKAKATFFVTGQRAQQEPEKISAILYSGHALGNHTHSHVALTGETQSGIESEFNKANNAVIAAGGPPMTCYRAPFGLNDGFVKQVASGLGMKSVNWSVDTRDWDRFVDDQTVFDTLNRVKNGSIVLMHDGPLKRNRSVEVISSWLSAHAHQYQFLALPQCKPYGASEIFATVDEQEIDLPLVSEDIPSLLEKLRSYRFGFQVDSIERERSAALQGEELAVRVF